MESLIRDILAEKSPDIQFVAPETIVRDAVHLMNTHNIGCVLVMEDETRLVGLFSERDALRRVVDSGIDASLTPIAEVMTHRLCVVSPDHNVGQALQILNERGFRHLPVVENDKVIGILSIRDLTQWVMKDQQNQIGELTDYIAGSYGT